MEKSMIRFCEFYACQLLHDESDLKGGEEMMEAAQIYLRGVQRLW